MGNLKTACKMGARRRGKLEKKKTAIEQKALATFLGMKSNWKKKREKRRWRGNRGREKGGGTLQ